MLPRPNKLTRSDDFRKAVKNGVRAGSHVLVVHAYDRSTDIAREGGPRTGLVVSKAVGNAVVRHRTSRRLRHLAYTAMQGGTMRRTCDYVIRALPAIATAEPKEVAREFDRALAKAHKRLDEHQA
ncbi:ribonuclease P protein component [Corynebacterium pyruviciproducens]|uniref:ribonuclease P protein component n=1 Tax=Corynebacterium pyruviciproducens TaxID=598660 RepID=UPI00058C042B|nr:ribonuclease P protein component [Corynebacterium pyruviciproducens]MDH4658144.1 ribonuclease P protein component [Corynebacterium pyruviciproducens]